MSKVVVEFYKIVEDAIALVQVRSEECYDEFEADALIEQECHLYDVVKIVPVKQK
jgi:hypothetical protein